MEFTTSDGRFISENLIQNVIIRILTSLKKDGDTFILDWQKEFFEWFLDKKIAVQDRQNETVFKLELYRNITEEDLEQLEQLIDYLEL